MNFELNLCRLLSHSAVFFSTLEWLPVRDCVCFGKSTSQASQAVTQQQVGAQGGGAGSSTNVAGAGAQTASKTAGNVAGKGSTQTNISVTSNDDPQAIAAVQNVATNSNENNTALAGYAISSQASVANNAISALSNSTSENDSFGEAALNAAENAQATSTTALETNSAEYAQGLATDTANAQITANNALNGSSQPLSQGDTAPGANTGTTEWSTVATWIGIIGGLLTIGYYVSKKQI